MTVGSYPRPALTAPSAHPRATPIHAALDPWALVLGVLALFLAQLPHTLAACCGPADQTGLGSVWFVNDYAQYESAIRQGAERRDWLVHDPFTAERHEPAFMFPLYVAVGKLSALTSIDGLLLLRVVEFLARAIFVVALWRFARRFASGLPAARAAFAFALFGSGIGMFVAAGAFALGLPRPYTGNFSYELNTLGLLFGAPHVPLALAASLELTRWLLPERSASPAALAYAAFLGGSLALLHPFHVPVFLGALGIVGLMWVRLGRGWATLAIAVAAGLGALPALLPTLARFTLDPFWGTAYTQQNHLPSPIPHLLFVDLGVILLLAVGGAWFLRDRLAPIGLLILAMLLVAAMYVPVPYQRRLGFGVHPVLALLAANAFLVLLASVGRRSAMLLRLATATLLFGGTIVTLVSISLSAATGRPLAIYRSTPDLDAAAAWLETRVEPDQVILADWDVSNYLAPRTSGRVVGGHPVATVRPTEKRFVIETYFQHDVGLSMARQLGADWVVYAPRPAGLPTTHRPTTSPDFTSGAVAVYRVPRP